MTSRNYKNEEIFEKEIRNAKSPFIKLSIWKKYLFWVEKFKPEVYIPLLERCLNELAKEKLLNSEKEFLTLWIDYSIITTKQCPLKIFHRLWNKKIGITHSNFYLFWAAHCIKANKKRKAIKVLKLGIKSNAKPETPLKAKLAEFESFKSKAVKNESQTIEKAFLNVFEAIESENEIENEKENGKFSFVEKHAISFEELRAQHERYKFSEQKVPLEEKVEKEELKEEFNKNEVIDNVQDIEFSFGTDEDHVESLKDSFNELKKNKTEKTDLENLIKTIDEGDTLSVPTKTISAHPNYPASVVKTPLPKRLFTAKETGCENNVNDTDTFFMRREMFLRSTKKQKSAPERTRGIEYLNPFDSNIRKIAMKRKPKPKIKKENFSFFLKNKITESTFLFIQNIKIERKLIYPVLECNRCSKNFFDFLIRTASKENCNSKKHFLHVSRNYKNGEYEAYLGEKLERTLKPDEKILCLIPNDFLAYKDEIYVIKYDFPPHSFFIEKILSNCPLGEVLTTYVSYQVVCAVEIMHKQGVIHAEVSEKSLLLRNITSLPGKKITSKEDWKKWWKDCGVSLVMSRFSFEADSFGNDKFIVPQKEISQGSYLLERKSMQVRNKDFWNFHIDEIGVCRVINQLLNGNELKIKKEERKESFYYKPENPFRLNIDHEMWAEVFYLLLNSKEGESISIVREKLFLKLSSMDDVCQQLVRQTAELFSKPIL